MLAVYVELVVSFVTLRRLINCRIIIIIFIIIIIIVSYHVDKGLGHNNPTTVLATNRISK